MRYRGKAIPELAGQLIVADWSADFKAPSGQIFVAQPSSAGAAADAAPWPYRRVLRIDSRIIGLAEDAAGEIFVLTNETLGPFGTTGKVWRLVRRPD